MSPMRMLPACANSQPGITVISLAYGRIASDLLDFVYYSLAAPLSRSGILMKDIWSGISKTMTG
ncbi:hypothetical protein D3C80_1310770 [compost metagenome]